MMMANIPKSPRSNCYFECNTEGPLHHFPKPEIDIERFEIWKAVLETDTSEKGNMYIYNQLRLCNKHFENYYILPSNRLTRNAIPTLYIKKELKLEVCIDCLESARNAIQGGADELEVCSSLAEGGLTPSPGLVKEIMRLVLNKAETLTNNQNTKVNVMIRCRGGSDFCYTNNEMETMLADIEIYKDFGVNRFVFGALTNEQEIDKENCMKVLNKAHPIPVTFHRAFDLCKEPEVAINDIIGLGFNRILTSGQKPSAADESALQLLDFLLKKYNDKIEIMPGAGVNCDNVNLFVKSGFSIIHSSCKKIKQLPDVGGDLNMGSNEMYVTDENIVKNIKKNMKLK